MKKKNLHKWLLWGFLVGIGVIIGMVIMQYHDMPLIETINIIDLATLITTIFLAVYIPEVLDRKLQIKRDKQELIENRIQDLQILYRRANLIVQQENISAKDMATLKNTLDVCQFRLRIIITLLSYSGIETSFDEEIKTITQLTKEHAALLRFEDMGAKPYAYPDETKDREEYLYNQIDKETCLLIFHISEALTKL